MFLVGCEKMRFLGRIAASVAISAAAFAQQAQQTPQQLIAIWRAAVISGDPSRIRALSADPVNMQVNVQGDKGANFNTEVAHWADLKKQGLVSYQPEVTTVQTPQPDMLVISTTSEMKWGPPDPKTRYEEDQFEFVTQPGEPARLFAIARSRPMFIKPLTHLNPHLYEEQADAKKDIAQSLAADAKDGKKTILVFGGNWCYDCHILDAMFHQPDFEPTMKRSFRVVHVDIGRGEKNTDVVQKYRVNPDRGVPALIVLNAKGDTVFADKGGQFSAARSMDPKAVLAFLRKWAKS